MKKVIITGASSGIGLGVAEQLLHDGCTLGVAARRDAELQALAERWPGRVEWEAIDITQSDAVARLRALTERLGGMDTYVHVAGIGYDNPPLDPEREYAVVDTNAAAFARMVSAAYGYFRDSGRGGHIVAVTSVAGTKGIGTMAAYSASKRCAQTYLTALRQLAAVERSGVRITDIRPGWVRTPLLHAARHYPLEMRLDKVVRAVVRAIAGRRRVVYVDWRWACVAALWRLLPDSLWTRLRIRPD